MKIPKKKILYLLEMRRKAGEKVMQYDTALREELLKYDIEINGVEFGLNSVFLITEPSVCEEQIKIFIEERLNCKLKECE